MPSPSIEFEWSSIVAPDESGMNLSKSKIELFNLKMKAQPGKPTEVLAFVFVWLLCAPDFSDEKQAVRR